MNACMHVAVSSSSSYPPHKNGLTTLSVDSPTLGLNSFIASQP